MNVFNYIKSQLPIYDVVSKYVNLKAKGEYFKGNCPFHEDTTNCLTVSPVKKSFNCLECMPDGDVITFIANLKSIHPDAAADFLIKEYNLTLPKQ